MGIFKVRFNIDKIMQKHSETKRVWYDQNILGRFLIQLQVQMKTSLEVMYMNATYEVRSQFIVDYQRNKVNHFFPFSWIRFLF